MQALDRWEERLEGIFEGRPYDILDAALTDTVSKFPVHIQPFRDMIDGMRMDLVKQRYETFDELYEYCYRVAGTVGLMTTPIMGIDPSYKVCGLLLSPFAPQKISSQDAPCTLEISGRARLSCVVCSFCEYCWLLFAACITAL